MAFEEHDKLALLSVRGVPEKVVERLEQMGIDSLAKLAKTDPNAIT